MADVVLILGLAGVAGTIVGTATGAFIAARSTAAVEQRREARAEAEQAAALRGAARLVWLDLAQVDASLAWAELRRTWDPRKVLLPGAAWEEHRARLAAGIIEPEGWETVANAMGALAHLRETARVHYESTQPLQPGIIESVKEARRLVVAAAEVLRPVARMPARPTEKPTETEPRA